MARKRQKPSSLLASLPTDLRRSITAKQPVMLTEMEEQPENERPTKKRRLNRILPELQQKHDATSLVPFYSNLKQVPSHLKKCASPAMLLKSSDESQIILSGRGCSLDTRKAAYWMKKGWFSVTPERIADQIAERCRCETIIDAFCGVGGNAIAFAKTCERVIAIDNSPIRLALARHNAAIYGVVDRIEFVLADFVQFAQTLAKFSDRHKADVVFLSPPWGGIDYQSFSSLSRSDAALETTNGIDEEMLMEQGHGANEYGLANLKPLHGKELFALARQITPHVAFFLPRNQDLQEISDLVTKEPEGGAEKELIEVEEEWMGNKLKALTCYFGGLVTGQEHLWN